MPVKRPENAYRVLQVIGVILVLDQILMVLPEVLPPHPAAAFWRYGVFGLVIGRATSFLFADALILFAAYRLSQTRFLRVAGLLHFLLALALLVGVGLFGLDALQVRVQINAASRSGMQLGALRAGAMALVLVLFSAWVGFRLFLDGGRIKERHVAASKSGGFLFSEEPREPEASGRAG